MGYAASPSCLTTVNRVLSECGIPEVVALTSRPAKVALEGCNDAVSDIWLRQRWTFARGFSSIALVASQRDYALPARFDRMAQSFRMGSTFGYLQLTEKSPEEWWQMGLGTSTSDGSPQYFTIKELTVSLYPTPSADYITTTPTLEYEYFESTPPRLTTSDGAGSWDVPLDFYDAVVKYSKSRLKKYLEYPDAETDLQDYERMLQILKGKYREVRGTPTFKPRDIVYSEW